MTIQEGDIVLYERSHDIPPYTTLPNGAIITSPFGYLIKTTNKWIEVTKSGGYTEINNGYRRIEYLPSPPKEPAKVFKVGDKLSTREQLSSLPKGSVVRYYNLVEEIYRCNGDGRVCVIGDNVYHESYKIKNLGLHPNCMTILYLPEGK